MASRRRTLLAAAAAVAVVAGLWIACLAPAGPAGAQSVPATTVGAGAPATTVDATTATSSQQRVATSASTDRRVASENRRMIAVIGGLVLVAIALSVLTVRYVRVTRPVAAPAPLGRHGRPAPIDLDAPDAEPAPVDALPAEPPVAVAAAVPAAPATSGPADHGGADTDWEPRGTGEHERVDISARPSTARPRPADRAAALARSRE